MDRNTVDATTAELYAAYCLGRMGQVTGSYGTPPHTTAASLCAQVLGAQDARERGDKPLPSALQVRACVDELMSYPAAVAVEGRSLPAGVRLNLILGGRFPGLEVTDATGARALVRLYISEDCEPAWQRALEAMTSGKFPPAAETPPAAPPAPSTPA